MLLVWLYLGFVPLLTNAADCDLTATTCSSCVTSKNGCAFCANSTGSGGTCFEAGSDLKDPCMGLCSDKDCFSKTCFADNKSLLTIIIPSAIGGAVIILGCCMFWWCRWYRSERYKKFLRQDKKYRTKENAKIEKRAQERNAKRAEREAEIRGKYGMFKATPKTSLLEDAR
eukprot:m.336534 g.336534  ORF g.336534 m.336534 type:complete len:171 (+) comp17883_c0_seq1:86-598(+)